jgi:hypothetical protein
MCQGFKQPNSVVKTESICYAIVRIALSMALLIVLSAGCKKQPVADKTSSTGIDESTDSEIKYVVQCQSATIYSSTEAVSIGPFTSEFVSALKAKNVSQRPRSHGKFFYGVFMVKLRLDPQYNQEIENPILY